MKVLLLDTETSPNVVHTWGLRDQNIAINQITTPGSLLCYSAKWYGQEKTLFDSVNKTEKSKFITKLHALYDKADVVVGYNSKSFDTKVVNREFVLAGLAPPSPFQEVDLLRTMRGRFRFASNKLQFVCQQLGIGGKTKHQGHELWTLCMANDKEAWKTMEEYNRQDVVLLEALYDRLTPWIKSHPNHSSHGDGGVCPNCGHDKLQRRGTYRTVANRYARFQCCGCGAWSRAPFSDTRREERERILRGVS
jgi:predicted RNA-binding Zn-ribbon protein involved in translation (DUF1610 family)